MDTPSAATIRGADIIAAVKRSGVATVVALPDIVTSDHLLWPISRDPALRLIRVCKEDEGVSICSGLGYAGVPALLLMQHTGLLDSMNALRAIGVEYRNPVCMMVGLLGNEPGANPRASTKYGVRIIEPLLDVMEIPHFLLSDDSDVGQIRDGVERAYETHFPVVFLIGRSPE